MKRSIFLLNLIVVTLFSFSCTGNWDNMGMGGSGQHMYGVGGGFGEWIIWIVLFAIIGFGLFYLFNQKKSEDNPLDILKKRYAKGDITKEEYENMKEDL